MDSAPWNSSGLFEENQRASIMQSEKRHDQVLEDCSMDSASCSSTNPLREMDLNLTPHLETPEELRHAAKPSRRMVRDFVSGPMPLKSPSSVEVMQEEISQQQQPQEGQLAKPSTRRVTRDFTTGSSDSPNDVLQKGAPSPMVPMAEQRAELPRRPKRVTTRATPDVTEPTQPTPPARSKFRASSIVEAWTRITIKEPTVTNRQEPVQRKNTLSGPRYTDTPNSGHQPKTGVEEEKVYVLTLTTTESIAKPVNDMRKTYFPAHLNRVPAHLTLFHALPHSKLGAIKSHLEIVCSYAKPYPISTGTPFRMGRGVGINLGRGGKESVALHSALRNEWMEWLSDQDRSDWRPHWTVMNKVSEEKKVKAAFNTIRRDLFENTHIGTVVGTVLWEYNKGSWDFVQEFRFGGNGKVEKAGITRRDSPAAS